VAPSLTVSPFDTPASSPPAQLVTDFFWAIQGGACDPLSFDPSSNLFHGLQNFDPYTYQAANPQAPSSTQDSEFQLLHQVRADQTPAEESEALDLENVGMIGLWFEYLNQLLPTLSQDQQALAGELLRAVLTAAAAAAGEGKLANGEPRPYQVDSTLPLEGPPQTGYSYPSGHAVMAYAAATVLSSLDPSRANEFFSAAANVARSRLEVGAHFPADVAAGARLGVEVANSILGTNIQPGGGSVPSGGSGATPAARPLFADWEGGVLPPGLCYTPPCNEGG
jgi:membrane-associated phospholipid phosphatase